MGNHYKEGAYFFCSIFGYQGTVKYSKEDNILYGKVIGLREVDYLIILRDAHIFSINK